MIIPTNIDQVDWNELRRDIKTVQTYTPEQRSNYLENLNGSFPQEAVPFGQAHFDLVYDMCEAKEFPRMCELDINSDQNPQIFKAGIMHYLERLFL